MTTLNTYKVTWFNMFHGKHFEKIVEAESELEAEKIVDCNQNCKVELVEAGTEAVEHIIDAEEMLFEMDANSCDEITVKEGISGKSQSTYTRKQIEKSLGLDAKSTSEVEEKEFEEAKKEELKITRRDELKAVRKELNLSAKEMADKLNTPIRPYEGWELGRNMPGIVSVTLELLRKQATP